MRTRSAKKMVMSTAKSSVLTEANRLIHGQRMAEYGPPGENLEDIAEAWTPYGPRRDLVDVAGTD